MDQHYSLTCTAAPAAEPLTTAQAKSHLVVEQDFTDDDTIIGLMITAARAHIENVTGRQIYTATWVLRMDAFPAVIEVPKPPLQSVTSVAYVDTTGASQTLTVTTDYTVDIYSTPGRIVPAYGCSWPSTYGHVNDVTVTYVAGYGATDASYPAPIIHALKLILGELYEHRERFIVGDAPHEFPTVDRLLASYEIHTGI